jgi:hypothetical protein
MSEIKLHSSTGEKLVTTRRGSRMAGLSPRQFLRTAEAAGLRVVRFPGLPPKFYASDVAKLVADAQAQTQPQGASA